jgi:hypothetical protein
MKLDPGMHIGLHLVFFGKSGVTLAAWATMTVATALIAESLERLTVALSQL